MVNGALPVPIAAPINTADNEGPMAFSHDFKTMYFTRCGVKEQGCTLPNMDVGKKR